MVFIIFKTGIQNKIEGPKSKNDDLENKDVDINLIDEMEQKLNCVNKINHFSDTNLVSTSIDRIIASEELNCSNINKCFTILFIIILFSKVIVLLK